VHHVGEENPAAVAAQAGHADAQGTNYQGPVEHFLGYDRMVWSLRRWVETHLSGSLTFLDQNAGNRYWIFFLVSFFFWFFDPAELWPDLRQVRATVVGVSILLLCAETKRTIYKIPVLGLFFWCLLYIILK